ncbi:MAG: VWA domain-containing protein [Candidatus Heimdallarchaeota archaeon]|nr:VWA domain-containing protein [Candidatus Heimdallarchaeota archaeon]
MKLNKKEILFSVALISCLIVPSLTVFGQGERILESPADVLLSESPLANVTIEMISDLPSHRADGIPSTLPDSSFAIQFNITNLSSQELNQLELASHTNDYGTIMNPLNETKDTLGIYESWLSQEYIIEASDSSVSSNSLDLAIVLDQSGSMGDEIDALTDELAGVINEISDQVSDLRISLILFGGYSSNPYLDSELVYPLTNNVEEIVSVLKFTDAEGSHEPWGDALWVAQNRLDWREDVVKLIVLITDEPCDGGEVIGAGSTADYNGVLLYELFENLELENFILCSIAASGADSLTKQQLESGAEYTDGTYILLGGDGYQTGDIPEIIGELVVYYATELNLKITVTLSHLNDLDIVETIDKVFVVLLDDIAPEIDSWTYITEDFITDEKFVSIMCEVKDVTGTAFVDIYYKTDNINFWIIANATQVFNFSYVISVPYDQSYNLLYYQVYSEDWLGNSGLTEIVEVNISDLENKELINTGIRKEYILLPNQGIICKLIGDALTDSFGLIFSKQSDSFSALAADINDSAIILDNNDVAFQTVTVKKDHLVKVSLIAQDSARVVVTNVRPLNLNFEQSITEDIDKTEAYLFRVNNIRNDERDRSFVADSQIVQTCIIVFNASNWEHISTGSSEVILPEEDLYILVYAEYHTGEISISFNYEDEYDPYDHYWTGYDATPFNFWSLFIALLSIGVTIVVIKRKR